MSVKPLAEIEKEIVQFIGDLLSRRGKDRSFSLQENLLQTGRLDSLAIVETIVFLEQNFDLDFSDSAFDPEDFETAESIIEMCHKKGAARV